MTTTTSRSSSTAARRSNPLYHSNSSSSTTAAKQIGIPFLWEDLPGIPKKQTPPKRSSSSNSALPLPPAARPSSNRVHHGGGSARRDPFLTALLECSKDGGESRQGRVVIKKSGDQIQRRMGIMGSLVHNINYHDLSCKRSCGTVSDSLVLLPGSASRRRPYRYDLFNHNSSA